MSLFALKISIYYSPGGNFVVKLVIYPGFSNVLSETLRTYTFLVMVSIVGQIKSIIRKVWKIKPRIATLGVPPRIS